MQLILFVQDGSLIFPLKPSREIEEMIVMTFLFSIWDYCKNEVDNRGSKDAIWAKNMKD
jgi:hypothetical protein